MFIGLIPIIGGIVLLVFFSKDSLKESNKWGKSPKYKVSACDDIALDPIEPINED